MEIIFNLTMALLYALILIMFFFIGRYSYQEAVQRWGKSQTEFYNGVTR